jgi:hypothetical protein
MVFVKRLSHFVGTVHLIGIDIPRTYFQSPITYPGCKVQ